MLTFTNENDPRGQQFESWRSGHGNWYVLNVKTGNEVWLHRAYCSAFDFDIKVNLSRKPKLCSQDFRELESWARTSKVKKLIRCSRCEVGNPREMKF